MRKQQKRRNIMNRRFYAKVACLVVCCLFSLFFTAKAQNINTEISAKSLVERYFANYGVNVSNVKFNGKQGDSIIGYFSDFINTNLGLNNGIVLSTGTLRTAEVADTMNEKNWPKDKSGSNLADADLRNILRVNAPIKDACVLEFDFTPSSNLISFQYVFASTEYDSPYFVCEGYHDLVAFFLTGYDPETGDYRVNENIALIPETDIPVGVNSIHHFDSTMGNGGGLCYFNQFSQYYVDNRDGKTITFPGFTTVLKAQAHVKACETYHLKLAIANVSDRQKQSMVFLEAQSLIAEPIRMSGHFDAISPSGYPIAVSDCKNIKVTVRLPSEAVDTVFLPVTFSGTAQNGIDCERLPDTLLFLPGQKETEFVIKALKTFENKPLDFAISVPKYLCSRFDDEKETFWASILNYTGISMQMPSDTVVCQTDPPEIPLRLTPAIGGGLPPFIYAWAANAELDSTNIASPLAYPLLGQENIFQLTVKDITGCSPVQKSMKVEVSEIPALSIQAKDAKYPIESCSPFIQNFKVNSTPEPSTLTICAENTGTGEKICAQSPHVLQLPLAGNYTVSLTAQTAQGCVSNSIFPNILTVYETPQAVISPERILEKPEIPFVIKGIGHKNEETRVEWLIAMDKYGSTDYHESDSVLLVYAETGNYKAILRTLNTYAVSKGASLVCDSRDTLDIIIFRDDIYFPTVITANGDGINDLFEIKNLEESNNYKSNELSIFDRWGKRVFYTKSYQNNWDGENLPTGTYFYQFKAEGYTKNLEIQGTIEIMR